MKREFPELIFFIIVESFSVTQQRLCVTGDVRKSPQQMLNKFFPIALEMLFVVNAIE